MPARASFRDLLRDLLARPVTVRPGALQQLDEARPSYLAAYRLDDGEVAALVVADLSLSIAAGAAIGALPPKESRAAAEEARRLEGDLVDFFHEVVNVAAKLFNSPSTTHVTIRDFGPVPGDVAVDIASLATEPRTRHDWLVGVDGYGEGALTLLG